MTHLSTSPLLPDHSSNPVSIKYSYALDENNNVIEIGSASVIKGKDYTCISCSGPLRPVMGEIRQQHFRHRVQVDCSPETYLHNLAKHVFLQTYNDCLANGKPFMVEYLVPTYCSACNTCLGYETKQADLTRHFKNIDLEVPDRGFIPDILLATTSGGEALYVEIAVTHFVEENKVSSGARIVEIHVCIESDIDLISSCCISEADPRVTIYNFKKEPLLRVGQHKCPSSTPLDKPTDNPKQNEQSIPCFFLFKNSGKCLQKNCSKPEYDKLSSRSAYSRMLDIPGAATIEDSDFLLRFFVDNIQKAYLLGNKIKNCWLCNFHRRKQERSNILGLRHTWHTYSYSYCNKHKRIIDNSNDAFDCNVFWIINGLKPDDDLLMYNRVQTAKYQEQKQKLVHTNNMGASQPPLQIASHPDEVKCIECGKLMTKGKTWWFNAENKTCVCTKCLQLNHPHLL